jgi:hypothetical protein
MCVGQLVHIRENSFTVSVGGSYSINIVDKNTRCIGEPGKKVLMSRGTAQVTRELHTLCMSSKFQPPKPISLEIVSTDFCAQMVEKMAINWKNFTGSSIVASSFVSTQVDLYQ